MKEIIEEKLKELEEAYDYWIKESDNSEREYIEDRLYKIYSQMRILKEVLEIYENSKENKGDSE